MRNSSKQMLTAAILLTLLGGERQEKYMQQRLSP